VFLIELAAVGDPSAVPDAVASVFGITQQPGLSMTGTIAEALAGRRRLVLLDNCEHVLDAVADLLAALLAGSGEVKVLATSREAVRLAGEHLWPVSPLPVRDGTPQA
jgi:predicted ATPase